MNALISAHAQVEDQQRNVQTRSDSGHPRRHSAIQTGVDGNNSLVEQLVNPGKAAFPLEVFGFY